MRKHGLLYKLMIVNAIIMAFVLTFLAFILSMWFKINFFSEKEYQFQQICLYVSEMADKFNKADDEEKNKFANILDIAANTSNSNIYILDKNLDTMIYSLKSNEVKSYNDIEIPDKKVQELKLGKTAEYISNEYIFAYPIKINNEFAGCIVIEAPISDVQRQLKKIYILIWISAGFFMIVSTVVLSFFTNKILINPLYEIGKVASKIADGEVNKRAEIHSDDEIGQLAKAFNIMAESLEKVENNRRDFISNVSHELRSPITSIKGFIAGILDGVIPDEKINYYLERVYNEIQRLTRLINDLLDLSAIESGKLTFNIKKININEAIKICVINNEQKIKNKNINIIINLHEEKCFVKADEDKIMQVITNLLDNAVKYCKSNGIIKIQDYSKGNKVYIEIYNNGPKINDEEINRIWERFYKSDKSRTNKVSTGLGLPIVKMLLREHGEEVWAENDPVEGVKFIFTLTKYKDIQ